ncbi:hypothetical protein D3C79_791730 [compost metagenome]
MDIKARSASRNEIQYAGPQHPPNDLCNDVGHDQVGTNTPTCPQPQGHRRVEVAAGDVPQGIRHGHHRQAKGQCDPREADPQLRKTGSQHRTPASAQHQPKCAYRFSHQFFHHYFHRLVTGIFDVYTPST